MAIEWGVTAYAAQVGSYALFVRQRGGSWEWHCDADPGQLGGMAPSAEAAKRDSVKQLFAWLRRRADEADQRCREARESIERLSESVD